MADQPNPFKDVLERMAREELNSSLSHILVERRSPVREFVFPIQLEAGNKVERTPLPSNTGDAVVERKKGYTVIDRRRNAMPSTQHKYPRISLEPATLVPKDPDDFYRAFDLRYDSLINETFKQAYTDMTKTDDKPKVADTRDAHTNEMKKSRGDFTHGVNWALKFIREHTPRQKGGMYGNELVSRYYDTVTPTKEQIEEAAKERFPLTRTRDRILHVTYKSPNHKFGITRYAKMVNGEVRFFEDGLATITAPVPPLLPEVVKVMADLAENPTEEVKV